MCAKQAKNSIFFFIPSPHALIEYLPTGPVQGTEEINIDCSAPVLKVGGDTQHYGMCLGAG